MLMVRPPPPEACDGRDWVAVGYSDDGRIEALCFYSDGHPHEIYLTPDDLITLGTEMIEGARKAKQ